MRCSPKTGLLLNLTSASHKAHDSGTSGNSARSSVSSENTDEKTEGGALTYTKPSAKNLGHHTLIS